MIDHQKHEKDENRDPLSGAHGAHPIGTGLGAAGGGATGAAIGAALGGPVGAIVGAAVGGVAGGLVGKDAAETVNPTSEDGYWRATYSTRPYATAGFTYEEYAPAYRYGWESRSRHFGKRFEDVEHDLEKGWEHAKGNSRLAWSHAKEATRDAWHRVEASIPRTTTREQL